MNSADLHNLLLDAATGDEDALERLRVLVNYGECIERAFIEVNAPRAAASQLKLVKS